MERGIRIQSEAGKSTIVPRMNDMQNLEYISQGRDGYVVYKDETSTIKFYFEFGGGNCVAIIFVPTADKWESNTKRSLEERENILNYVGQQATKDQTKNGRFKIQDNCIEIYSK